MYVILDTSAILDSGFRFIDKPAFSGLFEYLRKVNNKLILPKIVVDELKKNYRDSLVELVGKSKTQIKRLGSDKLSEIFSLDIDSECKKYSEYLEKMIKEKNIILVEHKKECLDLLLLKSLEQKKPFKLSGDAGFRDALIWETVKEVIANKNFSPAVFISSNINDFADTDKDNTQKSKTSATPLHQDLIEELGVNLEKIKYFNSINIFLSEYGEKIEYINLQTIQGAIDKNQQDMHRFFFSPSFKEKIKKFHTELSFDEVWLGNIKVENFFIYDLKSGVYSIEATCTMPVGLSQGNQTNEESFFITEEFDVIIKALLTTDRKTKTFELVSFEKYAFASSLPNL